MTTAPADHLAPGTRRPAAEGTDPMDTSTTTREYWRAVVASGATALPRWTRERSGDDLGTQTVPVPTVGVGAVTRIAAALDVDVPAVLLAAHARVLAALTAEDEVLTLLAGGGGTVLPVRLDIGAATWRELITVAARAAAGAREHGAGDAADGTAAALAAVRTEVAGAWPETVLDPAGTLPDLAELAAGEVLRVSWIPTGPDGAVLRVRHRTDVIDAGAADRIAGYHLTALAHLVTDLDATPSEGGLVGPAEARYSAEVLAGPVRELPDVRPHDLVRERARRHPDRPAVRRGEAQWSYRELDERSDAVARALLARGLRAEDVVAVVAERTLEWAAAVLGVLKAGGAYLPLEPHFPAGRIAGVITRAESRLVLAERGSTTTLDEALGTLSGRERVLIDEAFVEGRPESLPHIDPHVAIGPDRLAYLYFTSGSTGEPKGAMCEHAGMLNHLLAKIEDLGVREGDVVAQTAPQCFDISLWQLVAGWLVGATTLLVEQEAVLDVPRFVDLLTAEHVAVAQLVPSYLDVVVSYLVDQPASAGLLADLRCLAVTGEAVKKELVTRWFAVRPDVTVVNAYGLTETSDDTNHAVMNEVPAGERVPLGPAVRNVRVDIVDPHLNPVPLGAPGEIVFSGVCVGRGYINDPDRTAAAFIADPEHPGMRRYRSGDHGRWLPTGDLDFLGRRDHQVKISGFRIEIGEIENTLLRAEGVRDAAVVVAERPGRGKQLVGFYGSAEPIADATLREVLSSALPVYMVPPVIHHREVLPLTANGKIDRKVLTALALELDDTAAAGATAPAEPEGDWTPTERRLAEVWAPLLGVDEATISRGDHFFDRGASSLIAVKLAVRLGKAVTLAEITRHPVLTDLAALLDERAGSASSGAHAAPDPAPVSALVSAPSSAPSSGSVSGQDEDPPTGPIVGLPLSGVPAPRGAEPPAPLLHELTSPSAGPRTVRHLVVGVPPAGAHAEAFRPLARALAGSPVAVLGVDLPGHDPTDDAAESAFEGVGELARRLAGEVAGRATAAGADVVLWGHSAGSAIALATARELETRGVTVRRVLLGAQLPRTAAERRRDADALATTPDADLIPLLRGLGDASGADGGLDAPALRRAVAAYRHDAVHASRWIADALDDPASVRVAAPATVVVAADDPSTAGPDGSVGSGRAWAPLVGALTERVLPSGGHHFLLGDPRGAASTVQDALALTPTG